VLVVVARMTDFDAARATDPHTSIARVIATVVVRINICFLIMESPFSFYFLLLT
jgi:hypothetical protein